LRIASIKYRLPPSRFSNRDVIDLLRATKPQMPDAEFRALSRRITLGFDYTGSQYRHWLVNREPVMPFLIDACGDALSEAGLGVQDVRAIIYVGVGRGCLEPASAAAVQKQLGAANATSFDILEACVSWVRGLEVAQALLKAGRYDNVLLVNCEMGMQDYMAQDITIDNLDLYFSGMTVGEAATATVLFPDGPDFDFHFRTFPEGLGHCMIPMSNVERFLPGSVPEHAALGRFFALSRQLVNVGLAGIETVYGQTGYADGEPPQLTLIHSVSEKASRTALRMIGLDWERHVDIHASHGNTVSASIPLGMAVSMEVGRLERGTDTLLIGAGAGVSVGLSRFVF
jgi:3-oxoacyl-[acyl-carrier-protein] synthase III